MGGKESVEGKSVKSDFVLLIEPNKDSIDKFAIAKNNKTGQIVRLKYFLIKPTCKQDQLQAV